MKEYKRPSDGAVMRYEDIPGDPGKPAVVMLHGWGCTHATLDTMTRTIAALGRRVIAVDFPGFGESPEPAMVWGVDDYTRLLEDMLNSLGVKKPVLLGHSFGGRVAILYGSRTPADKLILVDAAGVKPRHSLRWWTKVYWFKLCKWALNTFLGKEKAKARIEAMRAQKGSADYASASPMMRAILSKVVNEDLKAEMPNIQAPTLLIWGEEDTATPLRDAKVMEKLIPDAGLVSLPGADHYSFLRQPGVVNAAIASFLS